MKVLITGGAGFIGSHLADRLIECGHHVRILDSLTDQVHSGQVPAYLNPGAEFVRGDVRDQGALREALEDVHAVAHLAAAVGVAQSQYQVGHYFDVNVGGTANLADVLINHRHHVEKILLAGSMTAYGEGCARCDRCGDVHPDIRRPEDVAGGLWEPRCPLCGQETSSVPTGESAALRAENIYAITKQTQEKTIRHLSRQTGVPHVIMRLFNVFGPRQSLSNPYTGVAAIFVSRLKGGAAPVVFEDGRQTRDFIWVHDVAEAMCDALETDRADNSVLNIGSGRPVSIRDLAERIIVLMNQKTAPQITGRFRNGDIRHCTAGITRAKELLDFRPRTTLDQGL
ncbi:MAG: SDR family NAD(P)-dependent oxidoreductase, partial [Phycisphaerales bacterium]